MLCFPPSANARGLMSLRAILMSQQLLLLFVSDFWISIKNAELQYTLSVTYLSLAAISLLVLLVHLGLTACYIFGFGSSDVNQGFSRSVVFWPWRKQHKDIFFKSIFQLWDAFKGICGTHSTDELFTRKVKLTFKYNISTLSSPLTLFNICLRPSILLYNLYIKGS